MKVKNEREVAQSCPTLSDPKDCSLPGSSVHGIFQARVLEGVPLPSPKKGTNDTDNHNGVITHLETDVLQCEVKWVLGSITENKDSGGDGIPAELFQILKNDAIKVQHSIRQQI